MPATTLDNRALIIGQVWIRYKEEDILSDFFEYNDIGVPLAFCYAEGIITLTPSVENYINETWATLLDDLNIADAGFDDLQDLEDALEAI